MENSWFPAGTDGSGSEMDIDSANSQQEETEVFKGLEWIFDCGDKKDSAYTRYITRYLSGIFYREHYSARITLEKSQY